MKTRVRKWGNSLALRIPKSFAQEVGLENASAVNVSLVKGKLVIALVAKSKPSLQQLLARITPENVHDETDLGMSVGREIW